MKPVWCPRIYGHAVRLTLPPVGRVEDLHLQVGAPCRALIKKVPCKNEETLVCSGRDDPACARRDDPLNPLPENSINAKGFPHAEETLVCSGRDDWI